MKLVIEGLRTRRGAFVAGPVTIGLEAGDCLALMGANGAGKTTLLETLAGFHAPEAGRIRLDGEDLTRVVPERRRFAYLPQDLALFPHLTVARNVAFAARAHEGDEVASLLDEFELTPLAALYPHQLSRGQAQRVALARALAARPRVLLLDEPTASLDLPGRRSFDAHMRRLLGRRDLIVVYATHNLLDGFAFATRLMVLERGRVAQAGAPAALLRAPADIYVAELLGITNRWPVQSVRRTVDACYARVPGAELRCVPADATPAFLAIGPGEVGIELEVPSDDVNVIEATVDSVQLSGQAAQLGLASALGHVHAALLPQHAAGIAVGQRLWIRLPAERLRLLSGSPGDAVRDAIAATGRP